MTVPSSAMTAASSTVTAAFDCGLHHHDCGVAHHDGGFLHYDRGDSIGPVVGGSIVAMLAVCCNIQHHRLETHVSCDVPPSTITYFTILHTSHAHTCTHMHTHTHTHTHTHIHTTHTHTHTHTHTTPYRLYCGQHTHQPGPRIVHMKGEHLHLLSDEGNEHSDQQLCVTDTNV